jgi:hypothetical protein
MEYTLEDVLNYWKNIRPDVRSRKRIELDPRNYIIALLYYKFKVPETELERIIGIDRSSVNHSKKHPYNLIKVAEATFMRNTVDVRKEFPYEFPPVDKNDILNGQFARQYSYTINFDKRTYNKIKKYSYIKDMDPRTAIRDLVQKTLALWEE